MKTKEIMKEIMKEIRLGAVVATSVLVATFAATCGNGETQPQSANTNTENKVISIDIPDDGLALGKNENQCADLAFQTKPITVKLALKPETVAEERTACMSTSSSLIKANFSDSQIVNVHHDRRTLKKEDLGDKNLNTVYRTNTLSAEMQVEEDGTATFTLPKGVLSFKTKEENNKRVLSEAIKDEFVHVELGSSKHAAISALNCGKLLEAALKDKVAKLSTDDAKRVTKEVGTDHRCEDPS